MSRATPLRKRRIEAHAQVGDVEIAIVEAAALRTKRNWIGAIVKSTADQRNGEAEQLAEVTRNYRGVTMLTLPTKCCGSRWYAKAEQDQLDYVGHTIDAQGKASNGAMDRRKWDEVRINPPEKTTTASEELARIVDYENGTVRLLVRTRGSAWTPVAELRKSGSQWRLTEIKPSGAGMPDGGEAAELAGYPLVRLGRKTLTARRSAWPGAVVRSLWPVSNGRGRQPKGMYYLVTWNHGGLDLTSLPCAGCRKQMRSCGIGENAVEYLGHVAGDDRAPLEPRDAERRTRIWVVNGDGHTTTATQWRIDAREADRGRLFVSASGDHGSNWVDTAVLEEGSDGTWIRDARTRERLEPVRW